MRHLLSGNEAIARGAYEAGVTIGTGYPGTPSTEILENLVKYKHEVYCEWSPNEKVAFEVAAGASLAGARSIVTMKHVGLNVAADPLMTLTYISVEGGFVACVADDPGMHSSQNEQDSRNYARFAKIPLFEPSDSQEAKDFLILAIHVSEQFKTPVILRTTTRVSHSRSLVELGERTLSGKKIGLVKDPPRFVPIPVWGRPMRQRVEDRLKGLQAFSESSPANRIEWRERTLGIITASIAYQYVREVWPQASVLKLGMSYPFPDALIREFAAGVSLSSSWRSWMTSLSSMLWPWAFPVGEGILFPESWNSLWIGFWRPRPVWREDRCRRISLRCSRTACRPARRFYVPAVLTAAYSMPWEKGTLW